MPSHLGDMSASVSSMSLLGCRPWVQSLGIWGEGESLEWVALEVGGEVGAVAGGGPPLGAPQGVCVGPVAPPGAVALWETRAPLSRGTEAWGLLSPASSHPSHSHRVSGC